MQGFEEAAVLISTDGLGYQVEKKLEPKVEPVSAAALALDPSADLQAIRAARRRAEIEAMSTSRREAEMETVFASSDAGDIDAAAAAMGAPKTKLSLRDQLAANKAASEAAWKEKHNPFKPPPGLSEDDYNAYVELEQTRLSKHEQLREQEQQDFTQFQIAMQQRELAVKALADDDAGAVPVGSAVPLPERDLDPSLSFSRLDRTAGAALLSPDLAATPAPAASAASASSSSPAAVAGALPPLVLLKRKQPEDAAAGKSKDKEKKKHKKQKKDKTADTSKKTESTDASSASSGGNALAGLIAYSDDDE